jgi:hypothetical protein
MLHALLASLALAALMTAGDWTWAVLNIKHTVTAGLVHGALMCLALGVAIGIREGRAAAGAAVGPLIGVLAAGLFYALVPMLRLMAMVPAWMFFWICFAWLQVLLRRQRRLAGATVVGIAAALLSGLAFYSISGIWTRHSPQPNYAWHYTAWTFAFFPGFAALFWDRHLTSGPRS